MTKNNCPFCGFTATATVSILDTKSQKAIFQIECINCGSKGPKMGSRIAASNAWNNGDFGYRQTKQTPVDIADILG